VTNNYDEFLHSANVDAVLITTPPYNHLELAKKAVLSGKHVLLEKPMVMNTQEANEVS
jgi:scyllo-inositol 2-dehydrogenase (NADP+)